MSDLWLLVTITAVVFGYLAAPYIDATVRNFIKWWQREEQK